MPAVILSGRLVVGREAERLEAVVSDLVKQGQVRMVFDMSTLDYADSAGIGAIVSCLTHVKKAGGDLRIAGANPRIVRLFKMTGVDSLMALYPTVQEATAAAK